jgi:hypothetical protein
VAGLNPRLRRAPIQWERGHATVRAWLAVALEHDEVPTIRSVALAETWRGGPRSARIAKLLEVCFLDVLDESLAKEAGVLQGADAGSTTIDAVVVASAARRSDTVLTTDPSDIALLAAHAPGVSLEAV